MSDSKRMTIEIPADAMAEVITEARKLKRFAGMADAEIVEAVLTAGASKITETQLKTRAKAHGMMIRKDGKGGYLLTDFNNCLMAPGPMTLEEVALWLDDLTRPRPSRKIERSLTKMNEKNYQTILEDAAIDIEKAHSVLFAVCTALQNKVALPSMMPALWDTVHRLFNVSERINTALGSGR